MVYFAQSPLMTKAATAECQISLHRISGPLLQMFSPQMPQDSTVILGPDLHDLVSVAPVTHHALLLSWRLLFAPRFYS